MAQYKNRLDKRTTIYLTKEQKNFVIKEGMNLSYFVREKLQSHINKRKVKQ